MTPGELILASAVLLVLGLSLVAAFPVRRFVASRRSARTLRQALAQRAAMTAGGALRTAGAAAPGARAESAGAHRGPGRQGPAHWTGKLGEFGKQLLDTPLGRQVVAPEDRRLLDQCGYTDAGSRGVFLLLRLASALVAPVLGAWLFGTAATGMRLTMMLIAASIIGFLLPKWLLSRRAKARRRAAADELPMMVDLLRLLQGVGLSLDQSLQVMINDFAGTMPVLASELAMANRQFVTGRTREQSLQRLATSYDNDDLRAVMRLIIQIDRYGGAVQEPLKQFGERLRETRRMVLREHIGRLTVKMTSVMIVTLLPALMIVTAGPGFVTVVRSLRAMAGIR